MTIKSQTKSLLLLELAFWFAFFTHAAGLVTMALMIMPGMPGSFASDLARVNYISSNPIVWKLGWLPWQLSALSDLLIAAAFLSFSKLSGWLKTFLIIATVVAIIPDQYGQYLWTTKAIDLATDAVRTGTTSNFTKLEEPVYSAVCGWASLFYTVVAAGWTLALKSIKVASSKLSNFSWIIWTLSLSCSIIFLCSSAIKVPFIVLAISNAIFFAGLMFWFCWVLDSIIALNRPKEPWGRCAAWKTPTTTPLRFLVQIIGTSHFLRRLIELVPPIALESSIDGVVYINYLVQADKLLPMVPRGLELQRLGPNGDYALFTALTFQHRNFGPQLMHSFRKFMLTGLVSNWRIHVIDPVNGTRGIYFLTNATDNVLMSLGARILSEGMPMHLAQKSEFHISENGYELLIEPGNGSCPDLKANLHLSKSTELQEPWNKCFKSFEDFLEYCVPQERSISSQSFLNRVSYQEIRLGIPIAECKRLEGIVISRKAELIAENAEALCFAAPALEFRFDKEHYRKMIEPLSIN